MKGLIITNGESAAETLRDAGRTDAILPWQDVLHEGPIVRGPLEACSEARAAYLAARLRLDPAEVAATFAERDAALRSHEDFDRVELWFEHDLYDQLQLVQLLSFFADEGRSDGLVLVQADDFLGAQRADTILRFSALARDADEEVLDAGDFTWADLAMPTPEAIAARAAEPGGPLPFLAPALRRFLEELPAPETGLGRTEATALAALGRGEANGYGLFRAALFAEEAAFMGDSSFFGLLDDLAFAPVPLIAGLTPPNNPAEPWRRFRDDRLWLTEAGRAVLSGEADAIALNGADRWWAGTHLRPGAVWRYDREAGALVAP